MEHYFKKKVTIIGVGYVGATIAYALSVRNIANEIVLVDIDKEKVLGEAMDIRHGIPFIGTSDVVVGDYCNCQDSNLIIICAGRGRVPGESRRDLARGNIGIIRDVLNELRKYYNGGTILIVSNPVDIITYEVEKLMGLPNGKVFGTGCILDTSRLTYLISSYVNLSTETVKCNIVGEHGENQIPIWSGLSIAGVPIVDYCSKVGISWGNEIRDKFYNTVKDMGGEIIKRKGRTHYGIATCVCYLANAVLNQIPTIAPVTSVLQGEYGITNVAMSMPSIVGINGVERRLEERWSDDELNRFKESAIKLQKFMGEC